MVRKEIEKTRAANPPDPAMEKKDEGLAAHETQSLIEQIKSEDPSSYVIIQSTSLSTDKTID